MLPAPSRVLVIGGGGFIGTHLCRRWAASGSEVHVLARPTSGLDRLREAGKNLVVHRAALDDAQGIERCLTAAEPDIIYHLATDTGRAAHCGAIGSLVDIKNLITLLGTVKKMPRPPRVFIRSGSIAEYGRGPRPFREDQRESPLTPYAAAMVSAALITSTLQAELPFPAITARLALTYGAGQSPAFLIPSLIVRCLTDEVTTVNNPEDRRDIIHVDDVVDGLCAIAKLPECSPPIVNIATGIAPTIRELASFILEATNGPEFLIRFAENAPPDGPLELRSSSFLMRIAYDWRAKITWQAGVIRTIKELSNVQSNSERNSEIDYSGEHVMSARHPKN